MPTTLPIDPAYAPVQPDVVAMSSISRPPAVRYARSLPNRGSIPGLSFQHDDDAHG
jgi:hypothetical protein